MKVCFTLSLIAIVFYSFGQATKDFEDGLAAVNPDYIKASMTFLSDDLLEGRQPGTRGFEIASKYVESQFIALGLKPGAEGGTSYRQRVPLKKGVTDSKASQFALHIKDKSESFIYGDHFLISPYLPAPLSEIKAPLVFCWVRCVST